MIPRKWESYWDNLPEETRYYKVCISHCSLPDPATVEGKRRFKNISNLLYTCGLVATSEARGAQKELTNPLGSLAVGNRASQTQTLYCNQKL